MYSRLIISDPGSFLCAPQKQRLDPDYPEKLWFSLIFPSDKEPMVVVDIIGLSERNLDHLIEGAKKAKELVKSSPKPTGFPRT